MVNLTFGEQVKIILSRKGMTIKELAQQVEKYTGKPMSRQNMTQKLGRDNFQEQDMRLIAKILGCQFTLSIMEASEEVESIQEVPKVTKAKKVQEPQEIKEEADPLARDITIGELVEMSEGAEPEEVVTQTAKEALVKPVVAETKTPEEKQREEEKNLLRKGIKGYFKKTTPQTIVSEKKEAPIVGDINPYTGKEYQSNSVRMHPKRIGYVQVYDQEQHKWTDMTEWAFLGYQERKKLLLGKDYKPPIYLD